MGVHRGHRLVCPVLARRRRRKLVEDPLPGHWIDAPTLVAHRYSHPALAGLHFDAESPASWRVFDSIGH